VPVGAVLIARDNFVSTVDGLRTTYSTREKAERELRSDLRRFERRGTTARNRAERQVKKTRTRVERELRQRRNRVQRDLKRNRTRLEREVKSLTKDLDKRTDVVAKNVELVSARVENAVQGGRTRATQATTKVQERIAALV
jgi:hypothetical protein